MAKNNKKIIDLREIIWIIIGIITFICGGLLLYYNSFPDIEPPSSPNYPFLIGLSSISGEHLNLERGYIRDLEFDYNFLTGKGNLSFRFYGEKNDSLWLHINLPKELNVSSFFIKTEEGINVSSCYVVGGSISGVSCENAPGDKGIYSTINVKGENFYPNGVFIFNLLENTYPKQDFQNTLSNNLIKFDLGKYRCSETCFINELSTTNLRYQANNRAFRVYLLPDQKLGYFVRFAMNTYDLEKARVAAILSSLGMSLMTGSAFFLLNLLRSIKKKAIPKRQTKIKLKRKKRAKI